MLRPQFSLQLTVTLRAAFLVQDVIVGEEARVFHCWQEVEVLHGGDVAGRVVLDLLVVVDVVLQSMQAPVKQRLHIRTCNHMKLLDPQELPWSDCRSDTSALTVTYTLTTCNAGKFIIGISFPDLILCAVLYPCNFSVRTTISHNNV